MNATIFALCQKPVLGPLLWIASLCAFPPPLSHAPVVLSVPGEVLSARFDVPVSTGYFLSLNVVFPDSASRLSDTTIGAKHDVPCYGPNAKRLEDFPEVRRDDYGRPVRLHVTVKRQPDQHIVFEKELASICRAGHNGANEKSQILDLVNLKEGTYQIVVRNLEARPDLKDRKTGISIHPGGK